MSGKYISDLLNIYHNGISSNTYLTDKQLRELIEGIRFLADFNSNQKFSPLTVYYWSILEALERIATAREE